MLRDRDWKTFGLLSALYTFHEEETEKRKNNVLILEENKRDDSNNYNISISRYDLRLRMIKSMDFLGTHTYSRWVEFALAQGFLIQNPTSHITVKGKIKPSNDTRYFLNFNLIKTERDRLSAAISEFKRKSKHSKNQWVKSNNSSSNNNNEDDNGNDINTTDTNTALF